MSVETEKKKFSKERKLQVGLKLVIDPTLESRKEIGRGKMMEGRKFQSFAIRGKENV